MKSCRCIWNGPRPWIAVFFLFSVAPEMRAQKPPLVPPNPQAPTLTQVTPNGMQRGTAVELVLTGTNLAGPTRLWTSCPASVTIPTDHNNGKDNGRLRVRLEVPKDVPIGLQTLRLATTRGLSNFRVFCIDDLPQVLEAGSNHAKASPQAVPVPAVVVGAAKAKTSDYYKISVHAGQRVSFEVLGRRLGGPLDPQLTLFDPRTLEELPEGYSDDAPGLQGDPRLSYTFKEAGDYLIEVRDVMWRGGEAYGYRLRIGDFPCATTPIPMAARRGTKAVVRFAGPTVDGVAPIEVAVPTDPAINAIWVTPRGANGLAGWPVVLGVSDLNELVEHEPNNEPAKANRVPVPGAITGRFEQKGDLDHFVFGAKKGQRYVIQAHTREFSSPTEVDMVLLNAQGTKIAEVNPQAPPPADQRIDFTAGADGDYILAVNSLTGWGGPAEVYRLTITPYEPDFSLALGIDRLDVAQAGNTAVNLMAARRNYTGPIDVSVVGPPGISGHAVIKAGQPANPAQPAVVLMIAAKPDTPMGPYPIWIQGRATIQGKPVIRYASVRAVVIQNMANLSYPPLPLLHQIGVAVTERAPFTLAAKLDRPESIRGGPVPVTITATRIASFTEPIALTTIGLPPNVAPALKNLAKGQNEVKGQLNAAITAPLGQFPIRFVGVAKFHDRDFSVTTTPVALVLALPFDLQVAPSPVKVAQGAKTKIKVSATRKGGYQGPIALQVRNLPPKVTAAGAVIAANQATAVIELVVPAAAAVGSKADVNILGTATAAANQQKASPNFMLSIVKAGQNTPARKKDKPPAKPKKTEKK